MRVPVRRWPVLFHYLRRLDATYALAREEGRAWVRWHLASDGVIFVSAWDLTEDERKRRCALPDGFDRAPWTRLEGGCAPGLPARFAARAHDTVLIPSRYPGETLQVPAPHHTLAPP